MTTARAGWLAGLAMTLLALAGWALDAPYVLVLPVAVLIAWWGFCADGPVPLHGLVFGPTLGQPE